MSFQQEGSTSFWDLGTAPLTHERPYKPRTLCMCQGALLLFFLFFFFRMVSLNRRNLGPSCRKLSPMSALERWVKPAWGGDELELHSSRTPRIIQNESTSDFMQGDVISSTSASSRGMAMTPPWPGLVTVAQMEGQSETVPNRMPRRKIESRLSFSTGLRPEEEKCKFQTQD